MRTLSHLLLVPLVASLSTGSVARADEASASNVRVVDRSSAASESYDPVLDLAEQLARDGDPQAASALAHWVQAQPATPADQDRAQQLSLQHQHRRDTTSAKVRLVIHEAAFGAFVGGAGPALVDDDDNGALYFTSALLGAAGGTVGAIALSRREDFGPAQVHALVAPQQLLTFTGAALGATSGETEPVGLGIMAGAAAGTGFGLLWALNDPDPSVALATHSGAFWGLGLTVVGISYGYGWDGIDADDRPLALAGGADLGAVLGFGLASALPVTEDQLRMANVGGLVGAGGAFLFTQSSNRIIWYTPHSVAAIVGGAGLVGGAVGVVVASQLERAPALPVGSSALEARGGRVRISVPLPRPMAVPGTRDAPGWGLFLVDQEF